MLGGLGIFAPQVLASGYGYLQRAMDGALPLQFMFLAALLKIFATSFTIGSGGSGGVFAPSLAIGAGIGHDIAQWMGVSRDAAIPLIALGMVGFLAATTQGPITAFIIVMEMVAGNAMVLSLMACALLASGVARRVAELHSMERHLHRLRTIFSETLSSRACG